MKERNNQLFGKKDEDTLLANRSLKYLQLQRFQILVI